MRFIKREYDYDWWFIFDREQKCIDGNVPFEDAENLIPMSEDQVLELLNKWDKAMKDWDEMCNEVVFFCDASRVWDISADVDVKKYSFYELLVKQSERIVELEEQLVDVEYEAEALEEENRHLKEKLNEAL